VTGTHLLDTLFLIPFICGLLLAIQLPLLGAYARMRGEWLASLGVTQVAAAGLALGSIVGGTATAGALLAAALAAMVKTFVGRQSGNDSYAVMLLVGWSGALLLAANAARGEELSHALLEGQIYFTGPSDLILLSVLLVATVATLWRLSRPLLLGCLLPDRQRRWRTARWHDIAFDAWPSACAGATVVGVSRLRWFRRRGWPSASRRTGSCARLVTRLSLLAYISSFATALCSSTSPTARCWSPR
jgi:zinc transport system permease protein